MTAPLTHAHDAAIDEMVDATTLAFIDTYYQRRSSAPNGTNDVTLISMNVPPVPADLSEPVLRPSGVEVMNRRIVVRDRNGTPVETPRECFWRVAWTVSGGSYPNANDERWALARRYYDLMVSGTFMPNSPCLVNASRPLGQLSACFVLPVDDSIESIYDTVKRAALIHQSGGGTGFSFSRLRPSGSEVRRTNGVASGPVTFMQVFDAGTRAIRQGATRRGANMGILHIDHPDIWEFIELKGTLDPVSGETPMENFNISVAMTDAFMDLVIENDPREMDREWLNSGHTPREIWDRIAQNAWRTGDPGVIFIDKINSGRANPVPSLGPIEATNPCGEQPLYPNDSCNLGSINLAKFAAPNGMRGIAGVNIEWDRLADTVELCVRFLDDVITVNQYPLAEIQETSNQIRRIGLGVMGWADLLIALGMDYDSAAAYDLAQELSEFIQIKADDASERLSTERGVFPLWDQSIYNPIVLADNDYDLSMRPRGLRNSTRTTIAPTGTISIIAGCSSGIEPLYAPVFKRQHKLDHTDPDKWFEMYEVNDAFGAYLDKHFNMSENRGEIIRSILERLSSGEEIDDLITDGTLPWSASIFRGAHEIEAASHVTMQAVWQHHVDNAVSKTINLPESTPWQTVQRVYEDAYEQGCKGITVYRNNSRTVQVLSTGTSSAPSTPVQEFFAVPEKFRTDVLRTTPLPDERPAITHKFRVEETEGYITVGLYPDGRPGEIFINVSKQGSTVNGLMDAWAILFSKALQYGIPLEPLCDKIINIRFEPNGPTNNRSIPIAASLVDYVCRWLKLKFFDPITPATDTDPTPPNGYDADTPPAYGQLSVTTGLTCPDCGMTLIYSEGCNKCFRCGYNKCG